MGVPVSVIVYVFDAHGLVSVTVACSAPKSDVVRALQARFGEAGVHPVSRDEYWWGARNFVGRVTAPYGAIIALGGGAKVATSRAPPGVPG